MDYLNSLIQLNLLLDQMGLCWIVLIWVCVVFSCVVIDGENKKKMLLWNGVN
jgi:hypothetical protein